MSIFDDVTKPKLVFRHHLHKPKNSFKATKFAKFDNYFIKNPNFNAECLSIGKSYISSFVLIFLSSLCTI